MSRSTKLPLLQLHLSTLLMSSLVAAILLWLNVRTWEGEEQKMLYQEISFEGTKTARWKDQANGWPRMYRVWFVVAPYEEAEQFGLVVSRAAMLIDSSVCLILLASATIAIEWLTRAHEARCKG